MSPLTDRPIFVVGHVKSGTTLLQSLLDGHPALWVLPLELKFFQYADVPKLPPGNRPRGELPGYRVPLTWHDPPLERVREEVLGNSDPADFLAGRPVSRNLRLGDYPFDEGLFRQRLEAATPASARELFVQLVEAFHAAHRSAAAEVDEAAAPPADGPDPRLVEKTPQQEEFAQELKRWFPRARFLHVLRNPYAVVNAEARDKTVHRSRRHRLYRPLAKSLYFLERNVRYVEDYRVVRYEELVLETGRTMREVAGFLDLPFRDSMLRPTVGGEPWRGNSRSVDGELEGVDPRPVRAWREQIAPLDVALVNRFFAPFMEKHGYDLLPDPGWRKWLPVGMEPPTLYLGNRALLFTNYL